MEDISHFFNIQERRQKRSQKLYSNKRKCTLSRLFSKILQKRIQKECNEKMDENQSGFISGRSCVDPTVNWKAYES